MKLNRRSFLLTSVAAVSSLSLASCVSVAKKSVKSSRRLGFFTIANTIPEHPFGQLLGGRTSLCILNVDTLELDQFQLPMVAPHSLIQSSTRPHLAVVAPRDEPLALIVDVRNGKVLGQIQLGSGENFYGHGFFSGDGESLFLTGYGKGSKGFLKKYDLNWRETASVNSFGKAPHDVRLIEAGGVMLIANNGWAGTADTYSETRVSSMAYVDSKSYALIEKIELPLGHLAMQHFDANERGDFVVGCDFLGPDKFSPEFKSLVAFRRRGGSLDFLECPPHMRRRLQGNILSIRWDVPGKRVLTTTPQGPLTIWNLETMRAMNQVLDDLHPHGIELSDTGMFVTTANAGIWSAQNNLTSNSMSSSSGSQAQFKRIEIPKIQNISAHVKWLEES